MPFSVHFVALHLYVVPSSFRNNCSYLAVCMRKQGEYVQVLKLLNDRIHEIAQKTVSALDSL